MEYVEGIVDAQPAILKAINTVLGGTCTKVDITEDIKVYRCGSDIRINCKIKEDITNEN